MVVARSKMVKAGEPGFYHCTSRCVRRAFMLGEDPYTGRNYDHRRGRIEDREARIVIVKTFEDLEVWKKSIDLAVDCYQLLHDFPRHEQYGLISQIQRAATSIPARDTHGHP